MHVGVGLERSGGTVTQVLDALGPNYGLFMSNEAGQAQTSNRALRLESRAHQGALLGAQRQRSCPLRLCSEQGDQPRTNYRPVEHGLVGVMTELPKPVALGRIPQ